MDRLDQLQRAFGSLQLATEKREQMEQQLRNKLEKELEELRQQEQVHFKYPCFYHPSQFKVVQGFLSKTYNQKLYQFLNVTVITTV